MLETIVDLSGNQLLKRLPERERTALRPYTSRSTCAPASC